MFFYLYVFGELVLRNFIKLLTNFINEGKMKNIFIIFIVITGFTFAQLNDSDFWEQTNGPYFTNITTMSIGNNNKIYCGTDNLGIFEKTNSEDSWTRKHSLGGEYIYSIASDSNGYVFAATAWGLYRSSDSGENWEMIVRGDEDPSIVYVYILENGKIIGGSYSKGIYVSEDNGNTWVQKNNGLGEVKINSIKENFGGLLFVCSGRSIFKSSDDGESWTKTNDILPEDNRKFIIIDRNNNLYVITYENGVYRSRDNGDNWHQIYYGQKINSLTVNSKGYIFCGTWEGILRSTDNGESWTEINNGLTFGVINYIVCDSLNKVYAGTYGGGVYVSEDNGDNWRRINEGLNYLRPYIYSRSLFINSKDDIFATSGRKIHYSSDNGNSWHYNDDGIAESTGIYSFTENPTGKMFAATDKGVYELNDSSRKWIETGLGTRVKSIFADSRGKIYAGGGYNTVFITDVNGKSWEQVNISNSGYIKSFFENENGEIIISSSKGVFRSTDNLSNWVKIDNISSSSYEFAEDQENNVYVATAKGVYRSSDSGITWLLLPQTSFLGSTIVVDLDGNIYCSAKGVGVYRSKDRGNSWEEISGGLINPWISSLAINSKEYLFAGADHIELSVAPSLGVYRSINPVTSIDSTYLGNINNFELYQNFPNPFNSETTFKFSIHFNSVTNLIIYDNNGQKIKEILKNKLLNSGVYNFRWNAKDIASGVYFCRLTTNSLNNSKKKTAKSIKIVLLK